MFHLGFEYVKCIINFCLDASMLESIVLACLTLIIARWVHLPLVLF